MVWEYEWQATDDGLGMTCFIRESNTRLTAKDDKDGSAWWAVYKNGERVDGGNEKDIEDCMAEAEFAADQLIGV